MAWYLMTDRSKIAVRISDGNQITLLQSELDRFLSACQARDTVESDMRIRLCHHKQLQQAQVEIELISAFGATTYREKIVAKVEGENLKDGCMNLFIQESRHGHDPLGAKIDNLVKKKGKPLEARKVPKLIEGTAKLLKRRKPHEMKPASFCLKWTLSQSLHDHKIPQAMAFLRAARVYMDEVAKEQDWDKEETEKHKKTLAGAWDLFELSERVDAIVFIKKIMDQVTIDEEVDSGEKKEAV